MDAKINLMTINSILVQIIFNCKSLTRFPFYRYKDETKNLFEEILFSPHPVPCLTGRSSCPPCHLAAAWAGH